MNSAEQGMIAFSRQEISGHAAVRALVECDEWYVPALFATDALHTNLADHMVILSLEFQANPRRLVLFTSAEAAGRATGAPFGPVSGKFRGAEVFAAVKEEQFDVIDVNPGSPREETFYMESESFAKVRLIVQTVRLEQELAKCSESYVPFRELKEHPGYVIAVSPEGQVLSVEMKNMTGGYALVFTSPDRFEMYAKASGQNPATAVLAGESLFSQLHGMSFSGVLINLGCPKYFALPRSFFPHIVAA